MQRHIERLKAEQRRNEMLQRQQYDEALVARRNEEERVRQEQEQEQHSADWQMRKARVSQYTQFLRGMASDDARRVVDETHYNVQQSFYGGGTISERVDGDVNMEGAEEMRSNVPAA